MSDKSGELLNMRIKVAAEQERVSALESFRNLNELFRDGIGKIH